MRQRGTNFVSENTQGMSEIGVATTLIHEGVHAFILAEADFDKVEKSDHHVPYSEIMFQSTLEGLQEYNSDKGLNFTDRQLKLLAANGLWGTKAVNNAFGLDSASEDYDQQLNQLRSESKGLFFNNQKDKND